MPADTAKRTVSNLDLLNRIEAMSEAIGQLSDAQGDMKTEVAVLGDNMVKNTQAVDKLRIDLYGENGSNDKPGVFERVRSLEKHRDMANKLLWIGIGTTVTGIISWVLALALTHPSP